MNRLSCFAISAMAAATLVACSEVSAPGTKQPGPLPADALAFDYYRGHLYFDAVLCDSLPARLVFDTGATGLLVDASWCSRSGLKPRRVVSAHLGGAGAEMSVVPTVPDTLTFEVDTLRLESRMTPMIDLKAILGRRADGLFGQDHFSGRCVLFDLRRGYMRGVDPDTLAAAGFVRIAAEKYDSYVYVPARVRFDDRRIVEGRFLLDMGCGSTLIVNAPAARKADFAGYAGKRVRYATAAGGIGGRAEEETCRADSVGFGGRTFARVPVSVSYNEGGYLAREDVAGVIGNRLLERFLFAIDFVAPALWVRPAERCDAPFGYETAGFTAIDRTDVCDGWVVTGLWEGLAPDGLLPGAAIVAWNGEPLAGHADADSLMRSSGNHRIEVSHNGMRTHYDLEIREIL